MKAAAKCKEPKLSGFQGAHQRLQLSDALSLCGAAGAGGFCCGQPVCQLLLPHRGFCARSSRCLLLTQHQLSKRERQAISSVTTCWQCMSLVPHLTLPLLGRTAQLHQPHSMALQLTESWERSNRTGSCPQHYIGFRGLGIQPRGNS